MEKLSLSFLRLGTVPTLNVEVYGHVLHVICKDQERIAADIRKIAGVDSVTVYAKDVDFIRVICSGDVPTILAKIRAMEDK